MSTAAADEVGRDLTAEEASAALAVELPKDGDDTFNADERAKTRQAKQYVIGGKLFHPRKRTNKMLREWAEADPISVGTVETLREMEKENPLVIFESITKQLNVLLRDPDGNEPGMDFLDEELDVEDGFDILDQITPSGGGRGNSSDQAAS